MADDFPMPGNSEFSADDEKAMRSLHVDATNSGMASSGSAMTPQEGYAGAPAYGASLDLTPNVSLHAQYQAAPHAKDGAGAMLNFHTSF
jgi:hypothetical protein